MDVILKFVKTKFLNTFKIKDKNYYLKEIYKITSYFIYSIVALIELVTT